MKRAILLLIVLSLLLSGCSSSVKPEEKKTEPKEKTSAATTETAPPTEVPDKTQSPEPTVPETTVPSEPVEETPVTPETEAEEPTQPEEPKEETPPQTQETEQQKPTQESKPQETKPQQPAQESKPQQTPSSSVPGRKVSSATCKDTGSDKIWENPESDALDSYEERDPERKAYLQKLAEEGNSLIFYIEEQSMRMYLGRTYGMPLYTDAETALACTWESSDPSVATVGPLGFVTPLKEGKTVISVTSFDEESQQSTTRKCNVEVKKEPVYTFAYLEQRAHEEAQKIAEFCMENGKTDLERIAIAAAFINIYVARGVGGSRYEVVNGELVSVQVPGYNQPFGTLVSFHSTCAGDTRALGLVLEYMGFEWYHVNENQWDHQWCIVYDVDGQTAFADGSVLGMAGYGDREGGNENWMWYRNGGMVSVY